MTDNHYHFISHWRVRGTAKGVFSVLQDPCDLPRWWPSVYHSVTETDQKQDDTTYEMATTGWLPYALTWELHPIEKDVPYRIELESTGDLVGPGIWQIENDGQMVDVTYDWDIRAEKPLLRWLSPIARPIFKLNHQWAMEKGEESLQRELDRRQSQPTDDVQHSPPPGSTTTIRQTITIAVLLFALCFIYFYR